MIQDGKHRISVEVSLAIKSTDNFDAFERTISQIEQSSFVPPTDRKSLLISGWESSVQQLLEGGVINPTEEARLAAFKERFALTNTELDKNGAYTKLVKSAVLREVLDGVIPERFAFAQNIPVNLLKGERVVWGFPNSRYLEDKVRRQFVGGSKGMSFRVAKGVYYRVGHFNGHSVEHTERVHLDTGWVIITNKNVYFAGPKKSLRLPYPKIVSLEPFSNGIGVVRDAANAKGQFFLTGDGWFTYNLVTNLSKM